MFEEGAFALHQRHLYLLRMHDLPFAPRPEANVISMAKTLDLSDLS